MQEINESYLIERIKTNSIGLDTVSDMLEHVMAGAERGESSASDIRVSLSAYRTVICNQVLAELGKDALDSKTLGEAYLGFLDLSRRLEDSIIDTIEALS